MKIFIIGTNGFIGNALVESILKNTDWEVIGMDIEKDRLSKHLFDNERFEFYHGDFTISKEWVEFQIKRCDVTIPLAAVAVPKVYIENPLLVFNLDFKENLRIIELVSKYKRRVVFPSTSEVYGMCNDEEFDEENSNLVVGPINKHRWIYSSGKQLLDRVIYAYGLQENLDYTLFRPFNWIGPKLDRIDEMKIGNSRVVTEFISSVIYNREIPVIDGGLQKRCFLYIDDGIDALIKIIGNKNNKSTGEIFNIGNPDNEISINDLAQLVIDQYNLHERSKSKPFTAGIKHHKSNSFYGEGYQDVERRLPSIKKASEILNWKPKFGLEQTISNTINSVLEELKDW